VAKANNIDLELVDTDSTKGISPEYLKINKLGKIPTFVGADGYILHEAIAIAIYSKLMLI
jgi:elongation factor 1-gamma